MGTSPLCWTMAGMASSGNWKGLVGITCTASMQSKGTANACARACDGWTGCALTSWIAVSGSASWKTCKAVMNLVALGPEILDWTSEAWCWCYGGYLQEHRKNSQHLRLYWIQVGWDHGRLVQCFGGPPVQLIAELRPIWNPSPCPMSWVGRRVLGISCHLYVIWQVLWRQWPAAPAACMMS